MLPQHSVDLVNLKGQRTSFWSAGNRPTQQLFGLATPEVVSHLRVLYLISDKVLAAASFFFESEVARVVTGMLMPIFRTGDILYFVDSSIETFSEHGSAKIEKSPVELTAYADPETVAQHGRVLDSIGHILRRPPLSLSDRIAGLWIEDVMSEQIGTLGAYLEGQLGREKQLSLVRTQLSDIACSRQKDYVWEYIAPKLRSLQLPTGFMTIARRRLAQMYALATSEYLGASLDRPQHASLSAYVKMDSKYDSALFLTCMGTLGVRECLNSLPPVDVVSLKGKDEFRVFREFYFSLIDATSYQQEELKTWLPLYRKYALRLTEIGLTRNEFLQGFRSVCRSMGRRTRIYTRPLDQLAHVYEQFGFLAVEDFVDRLITSAKNVSRPTNDFYVSSANTASPSDDVKVVRTKIAAVDRQFVRVCLVQLDYPLDLMEPSGAFGYVLRRDCQELTKHKIFGALEVAQRENSDLICFPELCFLPEWLDDVIECCKNKVIVGGSYYQDGLNTCPIVVDGQATFVQKINPSPCLEENASQGRGMARGKHPVVFRTRIGAFAVLICIDYPKEIHRILSHPDSDIRDVDFVVNPCYNRDVLNFQKQADLDCQRANYPYILLVNAAVVAKAKAGGTTIIGMEHESALRRYKDEHYRKEDRQIKYKLLEVDSDLGIKEMILVADLDIRRKGVPVPARGLKMRNVSLYAYQGNSWRKHMSVRNRT